MRATEWVVKEGHRLTIYNHYSRAREDYIDAVKRNKEYRASGNFFIRLRAKTVQFMPID